MKSKIALAIAGGVGLLWWLTKDKAASRPDIPFKPLVSPQLYQTYSPPPTPPPPPPSPPQGPPVPRLPQLVSGPLATQPGARYMVEIRVSFPANLAANETSVRREAEKNGFAEVSVSRGAPDGWPGRGGDYNIAARYAGAPRIFERSFSGGQVKIQNVWKV